MPLSSFKEDLLYVYVSEGGFVNKTSQEIADDLRDMCELTVDEVSEWMAELRGIAEFVDGKLVWTSLKH